MQGSAGCPVPFDICFYVQSHDHPYDHLLLVKTCKKAPTFQLYAMDDLPVKVIAGHEDATGLCLTV